MLIDWCPTGRIAELQAFIHDQWKAGHVLRRDVELLRWQFPEIESGKISVFIADDGGRIVGMFGVIPTPLNVRGRRFSGAMTANWITHVDYRNQPLGLELLRRVMAGGFAMVGTLGANALTLRLLGAMRFKLIERMPRMLRVFSADACRALLAVGDEANAERVQFDAPAPAIAPPSDAAEPNWRLANWSTTTAREWDTAWPMFAKSHIGVWRDAEYLNWRYAWHPRFKYVLRVAVEQATGQIGGLLVYRIAAIQDRPECVLRIVEFLAANDSVANTFASELHRAGHLENVAFADFYTSSRTAIEQLERLGFREEQSLGFNLPALFSPLDFRRTALTGAFWFAEECDIPAGESMLDGGYYFTRADGDQDRPN